MMYYYIPKTMAEITKIDNTNELTELSYIACENVK